MEQVKYLLSNNKFNEALSLLLEYVKKNPHDIDVVFHLGKVYFYLKEYSKSLIYFQQILSAKNVDNNLLLWSKYFIANILKFKDIQKALDMLISIREINSQDIDKEINFLIYDLVKDIQQYNFKGQYNKTIDLYNKYFSYVSKDDKFLFNKFLNEYEIASKQTVLKSKPRNMLIILSNICNINCIMCGQRHEEKTKIDTKFISFIKDNLEYLEKIIWQGGEPFLFPQFKDLLLFFSRNKRLKQIVITNFLLLNEEIIEFVIKNKIFLIASIDGANKKTYEKIRQGASFDKIIDNLNIYNRLLKRFNINEKLMQINFVVMKENYKEMVDIVEFAHKYGISNVAFIKCVHYDDNNELKLNKEDILLIKDVLLPCAYDKAQFYNINIDNQINSLFEPNLLNKENRLIKNKTDLFCHLPWKELIISYENIIKSDVLCLTNGKYIKTEVDDIMGLWNSKILLDVRRNIINNNLKYCNSSCKFISEDYLKLVN